MPLANIKFFPLNTIFIANIFQIVYIILNVLNLFKITLFMGILYNKDKNDQI